ncbi:spore germination protein (amino acid permease) [Evansella caseinilytica]|uniref:Spore germination protein (Amino acid permease) n=1 Tax=Evansella caseinilytica TaxID=1503961 RepID=A0A1H3GP11_9BACI|nr:endospore germination permease [Evansella caseinilytica]SDY04715.1 spore germination protein (amino acid permease) [Evansella caseinilytica]
MLEKGIISTRQFVLMLFIIITSFTALHVPGLLIMHAGGDAWLAVIGGWFLDVLLAIIYAYLGVRFPKENFVQYSMTILGKYAGRAVGILFPVFFLIVCSLLQRGLTHLIKFAFLPETPFAAILIGGAVIIGFGARKGIEVIARVCEIIGPIYLISIIFVVLMVMPMGEMENLQPQLVEGFQSIFTGAFMILTFFGICIMMAMFIPINNRVEDGFLAKFVAVSMGGFFVLSTVVLAVYVFGYDNIKNIVVPGLSLTRMIRIGEFIERLEIIWMMIAVGAGIMASAMMIWAFSLGTAQILSMQTFKPLIWPAVLLSSVLALTSFDNHMEHVYFLHYAYPIFAALVETGLIVLLFVMALILKKRGKAL